jgi:ElaB/YqjD/DUF883 family membrane-anchored ribosome-binding protein
MWRNGDSGRHCCAWSGVGVPDGAARNGFRVKRVVGGGYAPPKVHSGEGDAMDEEAENESPGVVERAAKVAEGARKAERTAAESERDALEDAAASARRTLVQADATLRSAAHGGEEMLVTAVRERPLTTVLAALAVGFLFGRAL